MGEEESNCYPPQTRDEPRKPAENLSLQTANKVQQGQDVVPGKTDPRHDDRPGRGTAGVQRQEGAQIMKEVLLEAQDMAVRNHNVEYKSNLYVAESFSGKGEST
uniref:Uncharacterized protein n=1 Tax=Anguilla anguilla TaxID=7936 RepID=A0A0E9TSG4_ANGAN